MKAKREGSSHVGHRLNSHGVRLRSAGIKLSRTGRRPFTGGQSISCSHLYAGGKSDSSSRIAIAVVGPQPFFFSRTHRRSEYSQRLLAPSQLYMLNNAEALL